MYRSLPALFATSVLLFLASCREPIVKGTGPQKTEQRQVAANFDYIESKLPIDADIQVVPGSTASIQLSGYANVLSNVVIKSEGNRIIITTNEDVHVYTDKNLKATIIVPSLAGLDILGDSHATVKGTVNSKELELDLAGSGEVVIDSVNLEKLSIDMAGSGDVSIKSGTVARGEFDIAGSGDIHLLDVAHNEADVSIAGSGSLELTANQKLNIDIAGSGDIKYKGHPAITKDIAGSGDIVDAN